MRKIPFNNVNEFAAYALQPLNRGKTFLGEYTYTIYALKYERDNSHLTMRIASKFTSSKANRVSLPGNMNVTCDVVEGEDCLVLTISGKEDDIRELARNSGARGNYRTRVQFKNFQENHGVFSADVLTIEIIRIVP